MTNVKITSLARGSNPGGDQWQIRLWSYRAGDDQPSELQRESFWTSVNPYASLDPPKLDEAGNVSGVIQVLNKEDIKLNYSI